MKSWIQNAWKAYCSNSQGQRSRNVSRHYPNCWLSRTDLQLVRGLTLPRVNSTTQHRLRAAQLLQVVAVGSGNCCSVRPTNASASFVLFNCCLPQRTWSAAWEDNPALARSERRGWEVESLDYESDKSGTFSWKAMERRVVSLSGCVSFYPTPCHRLVSITSPIQSQGHVKVAIPWNIRWYERRIGARSWCQRKVQSHCSQYHSKSTNSLGNPAGGPGVVEEIKQEW